MLAIQDALVSKSLLTLGRIPNSTNCDYWPLNWSTSGYLLLRWSCVLSHSYFHSQPVASETRGQASQWPWSRALISVTTGKVKGKSLAPEIHKTDFQLHTVLPLAADFKLFFNFKLFFCIVQDIRYWQACQTFLSKWEMKCVVKAPHNMISKTGLQKSARRCCHSKCIKAGWNPSYNIIQIIPSTQSTSKMKVKKH